MTAEQEREILGAMMLWPERVPLAVIDGAEDVARRFADIKHQAVFLAIVMSIVRTSRADFNDVWHLLRPCVEPDYIASLTDGVPRSSALNAILD